jgi:hypothetical protein
LQFSDLSLRLLYPVGNILFGVFNRSGDMLIPGARSDYGFSQTA